MPATEHRPQGQGFNGPPGAAKTIGLSGRPSRALLPVIGITAALFCAAVLLLWVPGMVVIDVFEAGGSGVHLRIPALLGHLAVGLVPEREWSRIGRSRGIESLSDRSDFRTVSLRPLAASLGKLPDGTILVKVDSPGEAVLIEKDRGALRILAESGRDRVRVEAPVSLVRSVLSRIRFAEPVRTLPEGDSHGFPPRGHRDSRGA
jgi:hypothetical protein